MSGLWNHYVFRRYHDLFILLAWSVILVGIMSGTFYRALQARSLSFAIHGTCTGAVPCQSDLDLGLIFAAAFVAGLLLDDLGIAVVSFLIVHSLASGIFIASLTAPVLLGLTDPILAGTIGNLAIIVAFWLQIPVPLILSFSGCMIGSFLGNTMGMGPE